METDKNNNINSDDNNNVNNKNKDFYAEIVVKMLIEKFIVFIWDIYCQSQSIKILNIINKLHIKKIFH